MLELSPSDWSKIDAHARHRPMLEAWNEVPEELIASREFRREEWTYLIRLAAARPRVPLVERIRVLVRALQRLPKRGARRRESHACRRTSIPGGTIEPDGTSRGHHPFSARPAEGDGV